MDRWSPFSNIVHIIYMYMCGIVCSIGRRYRTLYTCTCSLLKWQKACHVQVLSLSKVPQLHCLVLVWSAKLPRKTCLGHRKILDINGTYIYTFFGHVYPTHHCSITKPKDKCVPSKKNILYEQNYYIKLDANLECLNLDHLIRKSHQIVYFLSFCRLTQHQHAQLYPWSKLD